MNVFKHLFIHAAGVFIIVQSVTAEPSTVPQPQVVGEPYVRVATAPNDWQAPPFVGSPTLVRLESGDLLFCHDLFSGGSDQDTAYFLVSEDDGKSWQKRSELKGIFWPSVFRCASGLYVIGVKPGDGPPYGELCIARSEDGGRTWSDPVTLTEGKAVHTGNTGVLVSRGRVTVSFEVVPQLCHPVPETTTREEWQVTDNDLDTRTFKLEVADSTAFAPHSLVRFQHGEDKLHVRVLSTDKESNTVTVRPERWTAVERFPDSPANSPGPWTFPAETTVRIASGTLGNNRDFWAVAADADENADLCDPDAWRFSNPVGNPGYTHANVLSDLFGVNAVPRDAEGRPSTGPTARWVGWLEGVLVRLQHPGGDGSILNLMRVAGAPNDNFSARVRINDTDDGLRAHFDRFGSDPGLGVTHGCVRYDPESQLYWLASNVNRESTRDLSDIPLTGDSAVQERSNLALFYSRNCVDWFMAGMVAYSPDWVHSFHYPYFIIDGDDLLFAVRAHIDSPLTEKTIHKGKGKTADNHNSNAATFHRVPDFRSLVNREFIDWEVGASTTVPGKADFLRGLRDNTGKPALWDGGSLPDSKEVEMLDDVEFSLIKPHQPEVDGGHWILGVALAWHKGKLYASYGFNTNPKENTATEQARGRISTDGGKTWEEEFIIDSGQGDLGVSHGVFHKHEGTLWAFHGAFYDDFQRTHTRAYRLNETTNEWEAKGKVVPDGFWPMQQPLKMENGNWIMSGFRVSNGLPVDGDYPAVAISHGEDFTRWDLVVLPVEDGLGRVWGESTVVINGSTLVNVARYGGEHTGALVAISNDFGRTWTPSRLSNLTMTTSKPFTGTLNTGETYLIGTTTADCGQRRTPLTIAVSQPGEVQLRKVFGIRHGVFPEGPGPSSPKARLSYPYAVERDGKLYVGYADKYHHTAELAIIPLSALRQD